jgi:TPR repeat protein
MLTSCHMLGVHQPKDKQELTQEETYKTLGTMYQLGLGVEKDLQQAMFWYQKSGLLPN